MIRINDISIRSINRAFYSLWRKICCLTQRVDDIETGGGGSFTLNTQDTPTIDLEGDGSLATPLTADVKLSTTFPNGIVALGDGLFVPNTTPDGLIYGGLVTWVSAYTYEVSPALYYINGIPYMTPTYSVANGNAITLAAPDATYNRIDLFYVDASSTVKVRQGTPSSTPTKPVLNNDEIELSFALVETGTTQPTINQEVIYRENLGEPTEWTTTVPVGGTRIIVNSSNAPLQGTLSIEATGALANDYIVFTNNILITPTTTNTLITFKIKPKPSGNGNTRKLALFFRAGATPVGVTVNLNDGSFGYNYSSAVEQLITIPLSAFGLSNVSSIDNFVIRVNNNGNATYGFWIDDVRLQGQALPPVVSTGVDRFLDLLDVDPTSFVGQGGKVVSVNPGATGLEFTTLPTQSNDWKITGNTGLSAATNFFGTLDNVPLRFRVNNITAGRIDGATNPNTTFGYSTLGALTTGLVNNAFGGYALASLTTGNQNNAFGGSALFSNTTGSWNSAFGDVALALNVSGQENVAIGYRTLYNNTASYNTAVGTSALRFNTTGTLNSAFGGYSMTQNTTGFQNTALGYSALRNGTIGNNNVAVGNRAGFSATGNFNVFLGNSAGENETGSNKLYISNTATSAPLIGGDFTAGRVDINGVIKITGGTPGIGKVLTSTDAAGNAVWQTPSGGGGGTTYTVDNGLTENVAGNFRLGGSLVTDTTISSGAFNFNIFGSTAANNQVLFVNNAGAGNAAYFNSTSDSAGYFNTISGAAISVNTGNTSSPDTGILPIALFTRAGNTGTIASGAAGSLDIYITNDTANSLTNRLVSTITNVDNSNKSSDFSIKGFNANVENDLFKLKGTGQLILPKYGVSTFAGTAAYVLGVDATGNIVETAASGGGGSTPPNVSTTAITATTTISGVTDEFYTRKVNATAGNIVITITPDHAGQMFNFKRVDNTGNTVTFAITSGTIDGQADTSTITYVTYTQWANLQLQALSTTEAIIL